MKIGYHLMTAMCLVTFGTSVALAEPASKFSAQASTLQLVPPSSSLNWTTVLRTTIKTPNKKDLLVGLSFETGIYTQTEVKSKGGNTDTASSGASLQARILVDGLVYGAYPRWVVYDSRSQALSATLGGVIQSCRDSNSDGVITVGDECVVTDEVINLILKTMAAHHYNFLVANLVSGVHLIDVQVKIESVTQAGAGSASATATVGQGTLTVEEVRATNLPNGIEFLQ